MGSRPPSRLWTATVPVRALALLAALLLAAGCGTGGAPGHRSAGTTPAGGAAVGDAGHVLLASEATRPASNRASHAALATTAEGAVGQWEHFGMPGTPPALDYPDEALLLLAGSESTGCPIEPAGLDVDHDAGTVVALVRPHDGACPSDDLPRTLAYRVNAADLPGTPLRAGIEGHRLLPVR